METSPFRWGSASGLLPTRMRSEHPRVAFVCMILPGSQQDPSIFCRWPWFTQGRWEELFSGGNFEWPSTERMLWELAFQFSKQISLEGQLKFNSTLGFVMFCPLFFQLKTLSFHKSLVIRGIDSSWNPTRDSSIASKFSADLSGKLECKRYLQRKLGLKETTIGVLSWENLDTQCFFPKKISGEDVVYPRYTLMTLMFLWKGPTSTSAIVGETRRTTTPASWVSSAASPIRKAPRRKASDWWLLDLVDWFPWSFLWVKMCIFWFNHQDSIIVWMF